MIRYIVDKFDRIGTTEAFASDILSQLDPMKGQNEIQLYVCKSVVFRHLLIAVMHTQQQKHASPPIERPNEAVSSSNELKKLGITFEQLCQPRRLNFGSLTQLNKS